LVEGRERRKEEEEGEMEEIHKKVNVFSTTTTFTKPKYKTFIS
jgi:hypothetical protein